MAAPDHTPMMPKTKKRFRIERIDGSYVPVDEAGAAWYLGERAGIPINLTWRYGGWQGRPDVLAKTPEDAMAHLPSADRYELLDPDTPLVGVHIDYRETEGYKLTDVVMLPEDAEKAQSDIDNQMPLVKLRLLSGDTVYICIADTTVIQFRTV